MTINMNQIDRTLISECLSHPTVAASERPQKPAVDKSRGSKYLTRGLSFAPIASKSAFVSPNFVLEREVGEDVKAAAEPTKARVAAVTFMVDFFDKIIKKTISFFFWCSFCRNPESILAISLLQLDIIDSMD